MILPAHVEIMLAVNDVEAARASASELAALGGGLDAPLLRALSAQAFGAVMLAEGETGAALAELRNAWRIWLDLEVPYDAARVRLLIGLACRQLGDEDGAGLEFDAARQIFQRLGAAPDLARLSALSSVAVEAQRDSLNANWKS